MNFEVLAGICIGLTVDDWRGRVGFPIVVGIVWFLWFCFVMHRDPMKGGVAKSMRRAGVSEEEIRALISGIEKVDNEIWAQGGISKRQKTTMHYVMAFVHPAAICLVISVVVGGVKDVVLFFSSSS